MNFGNKGYYGYSMSLRAVEAYENGEMPLSKWTKEIIINKVKNIIKKENINIKFSLEDVEKLDKASLKDLFLTPSSWHHTGKLFNKTDFYEIDKGGLEEIDEKKIKRIVELNKNFKKMKEEEKEDQKVNFEYAIITYEEWDGSRRYGKYYEYVKKCIIVGNWAYLIDSGDKKNINGTHILKIEKLGKRKPKDFDKEDVTRLKKKLGI